MINKKEYPLVLLKEVQKTYQEIRNIAEENNDLIEITRNQDFELSFKDAAKNSNFEFFVSNPKYENSKIQFFVKWNPRNTQTLDSYNTYALSDQVLHYFKTWTTMIREYDKIELSPEERILNEYEKEFFDDFEIVDEDANINPYNLNQQLMIQSFLLHTLKILEKNPEENQALINEATELKNNLPKLTKKNTIKKLSKFLANVRQKSLTLLQEVFKEAKKELFKRGISRGLDTVGNFIDSIN